MDDMQGGLREAQRLLESTRLDQQYQGNIAFFETVMPDAFEMLRGHEPSTMHLSYDEGGFVSLVRSHDNSPLYDGDPRACTEAQFAEYGRRPKLLASEGMRTPDRLEPEANAHLSNSDKAMDLVFGRPQEAFEELPEYVNFLLMLGTGLGYQFELFLKATHVRHLCIIEPEIDVFWASCHTIDWRPILEHFSKPNHSFELIVGRDVEGCHHDLSVRTSGTSESTTRPCPSCTSI